MRWIVVLAMLVPGAARAGALGQVVQGLGNATGRPVNPAPPPSPSPSAPSTVWVDENPVNAGVVGVGCCTPPASGPDVGVRMYFGVQSVHDSNWSGSLEVAVAHENFGLAVRFRSFFEEQVTGTDLRLDLGSIVGQFRLLSDDAELWLEGGLGGVRTINDIHAYGGVAGARLGHRLAAHVGVEATARYYLLADDVRLLELGGGLSIGPIEISYRLFDFNVGPPLHGPEVGLALTF